MKTFFKIILVFLIIEIISRLIVTTYSKYNYVYKINAYKLTIKESDSNINEIENVINNNIKGDYVIKKYK